MTFTYFPNLPNPPDDPADDVAGMQTNSASIASLIDVDHVGFNTAGGGQHEQVTFNANNVPTPPVSPPVLFINNQDGAGNNLPGSLSELFFYSGDSAHSKNQYNVTGSNGSVMLMMGIILKWGSQSFVGSQNPTITFTQPFPNNCFGVQLTLLNTNATVPAAWRLSTVTTSGWTGNIQVTGSTTLYWFAIGN